VLTTPQHHLRIGPKFDYQINENNYLSIHLTHTRADIRDAGIGSFDQTSRGYHSLQNFDTLHGIQTSVHMRWINELRFGYSRQAVATTANILAPEIQVLGAFNGGGANNTHSHDVQGQYEFRNDTSLIRGTHSLRFGVRLRRQSEFSYLPQNFNGTFTFAGELAPSLDTPGALVQIDSLEQYRRTRLGLPGGTPSQYTFATGIPALSVNQVDGAVYIGDEWRFRPNLTFNFGIRYEAQTNINTGKDLGPRVGLAWAPTAKTVIRAGFGMFYDRFTLGNTLAAERYNGVSQQQYVVQNPAFFLTVPSLETLPAVQAIREVDANFRAPYLLQSALTLERQLPGKNTLAVTYTNTHGLHQLRSEDITPGKAPILLMTSSGLYNQNQLITNFNMKLGRAASLTGSYVLNKGMSNTDGLGTFPGNPYNFSGEYGPAITDIRHRVQLSGTVNLKWAFRLNPLITWQSGTPYNITTGTDPYDTTLFTARPGIATDTMRPGLVPTPYGLLDPNPIPGEAIIGRNAGRGPALVNANLRLTKTWGLGPEKDAGGSAHGLFSNSPATRRYNVSMAMSTQNIINHTNPGPINGNIESPLFGRANQVAGKPNGEGFSESAGNRRLELQLKFTY
jgi:hypothetical protein